MEISQTTAKMQHVPMETSKAADALVMQNVQQLQKAPINQDKVSETNTENKPAKVGSQKEMDALIDQLNRALDPFNTTLRFGFDNASKEFYVSVIDTQHNQVLRRFPVEQAELLLPKMKEVSGILFDQKG